MLKLKSEFLRNALTLSTGSAIAQLITLLFAPILSRIYTPEDFGRLALYLSIVQILGAISNGRYELAIVLPKEPKKGVKLVILCIIIALSFSFILFIFIILFSNEIAIFFGDSKLVNWLFFVPFSTFMIGMYNALNYFNTRKKKFKIISKANVFKASGGGIIQLTLGFVDLITGGLIVGQVMSHFFGNLSMMKSLVKEKNYIVKIKSEELQSISKRYLDFPKYSLPGIFLNTLSVNIVTFFVSSGFSLSVLGFYSYAYKYLGFPLILIGNSISQVYFQKLSELKGSGNNKEMLQLFIESSKKLLFFGVLFFLPLFFMVEEVFVFVFGSDWRIAGEFAKLLIPLMFIRFIVSPLSMTLLALEKQKIELAVHFSILIVSVFIWAYGYWTKTEIKQIIIQYSLGLGFVYILIYIYQFMVIKNYQKYED